MNDMVDITQDIGEAVRSTAILADVTISMWGAERSDAKVMEEVKTNAGATGNVGRVMKNMLAGADGLLKDTKSGQEVTILVTDELTLDKFKDKRIVEGDEIRCKFEKLDGKNDSKIFKKTAGC